MAARWPSAATTGVPDDVVLEASASIKVTEPATIVEGLDVSGQIVVEADDVIIRNTRVRTDGARYGIAIDPSVSGVLVEDVEVAGTTADCSNGIVHSGYTARRVDVHGCGDGLRVGSNTTVEASWIHSQRRYDRKHNDAIQSLGGRGIRIVGNNIEGPYRMGTSALILHAHKAPLTDVLIEGNRLSGGSYTVYLRAKKGTGQPEPTDVRMVDNTWVEGSFLYGPMSASDASDVTLEENMYDDGRPVFDGDTSLR